MESMIDNLQHKIEAEMEEISCKPGMTYKDLHTLKDLTKTWLRLEEIDKDKESPTAEYAHLTEAEASEWCAHMKNADGSCGAKWTVEETTMLAQSMGIEFRHISEWCWNVTCNMMYSDYYHAAVEFGCDAPRFYGELAKAFLFDPDGLPPKEKLERYYKYLVKPAFR